MASDGGWMRGRVRLGRSDLEVPRLGVGAMTWGRPSGRSRRGPAKLAYGGTPGPEEERRAFEASLAVRGAGHHRHGSDGRLGGWWAGQHGRRPGRVPVGAHPGPAGER